MRRLRQTRQACADRPAPCDPLQMQLSLSALPHLASERKIPAFHSGPKTILPPEGKDAATTARCSSSAPSNSGTETSQAPRVDEISSYGAAELGHFATDDENYAAVPAVRHRCPSRGCRGQVFSNLVDAAPISSSSFASTAQNPPRCFPLAEPLTYSMLIEPEPCHKRFPQNPDFDLIFARGGRRNWTATVMRIPS